MLTSIKNSFRSLLLSVAIMALLGGSAVRAEPIGHLYIVCNLNLDTGIVSVASISDTNDEILAFGSTLASCADAVVEFVGFGAFSVKHRPARMGRNPRTGQTIHIPASRQPKFRAGKGLKDAVLVMCEGHETGGMGNIVLLDMNEGNNMPDVRVGDACLDGLSTLTSERFEEKESFVLQSLSSDCITSEPAIDCPERYNFLAFYIRNQ